MKQTVERDTTPLYCMPIDEAQKRVYLYIHQHFDEINPPATFTPYDVRIVWFCYILGGWKALVTVTNLEDNRYYEVTYDINNNETYLDVYEKVENVCYKRSR